MCVGNFGRASTSQLCVQSVNCSLSVFESEHELFKRNITPALHPGPIIYAPQSDSIITAPGGLLSSIKFSALAAASNTTYGKKLNVRLHILIYFTLEITTRNLISKQIKDHWMNFWVFSWYDSFGFERQCGLSKIQNCNALNDVTYVLNDSKLWYCCSRTGHSTSATGHSVSPSSIRHLFSRRSSYYANVSCCALHMVVLCDSRSVFSVSQPLCSSTIQVPFQ